MKPSLCRCLCACLLGVTLPAFAQQPPKAIPVAEEAPAVAPQRVRFQAGGIAFDGFTFDARTHQLRVADQAGGPGSQWADSATAARSINGHAAINAGFFTPQGAPLGLVRSHGNSSGAWNGASSLGSGIWWDDGKRSGLSKRSTLGRTGAIRLPELLQSGPWLIMQGKAVAGLEAQRSTPRSFMAWDGGHRWWVARSSACSLQQLAHALTGANPGGWKVREALNLDGGSSAEIWFGAPLGGPQLVRPFWNKPVRNFLVLLPRG